MHLEMIEELNDNVGKYVKLQITIGEGLPGDERVEFVGTILELRRGDRILVFEHSKESQKLMGIKRTTIDLRSTRVWALDELIPLEDYEEDMEGDSKYVVTTIPCPYCKKDVHLVERNPDFTDEE